LFPYPITFLHRPHVPTYLPAHLSYLLSFLGTQPHYHRTCLLLLPTLFPMPPTYLHVHKIYTPYIGLFTITCTTLVYSHAVTFQFFVFWENPVVQCEIGMHISDITNGFFITPPDVLLSPLFVNVPKKLVLLWKLLSNGDSKPKTRNEKVHNICAGNLVYK
jgi:hypothetical protein